VYSDYVCSLLGERKIWVKKYGQKVKRYILPPSLQTVEQLYEKLGFNMEDYHNYLIMVNNEQFDALDELDDITTSEDHPLIIQIFSYFDQYESGPVTQQFCCPTTSILNLPNFLPNAFHKGRRVDCSLSIWSLFTSQTDPLIFKDSNITIVIDGTKKEMKGAYNNLNDLFAWASHEFNCEVDHVAYNKNGGVICDLDDFLLHTKHDMRHLHFYPTKLTTLRYHHSQSVSAEAKTGKGSHILKYSESHEIYQHWLSLSVYESFLSDPNSDDIEFSKLFKKLMKVEEYKSEVLGNLEYTYSSVFSRALDRFLFPDMKKGCVLHQPVLAKDLQNHSNRPDAYIACLSDDLPSSPILVSDFKKEDKQYNDAVNESVGYFQCVATIISLYVPLLVMPCTPNKLSFFVLAHWCSESCYD